MIQTTTSTGAVSVILASKRFTHECLTQIVQSPYYPPLQCQSASEIFEHLQRYCIDWLVLDVDLLKHQTQQFCWSAQNKYPNLKIVLVGVHAEEFTSYNWVYEFPNISKVCLSSQPELRVVARESAMPCESHSSAIASSTQSDSGTSPMDSIVGAAIFDLNGLPREYLISNEVNNMNWVQTIFQVLGLRSLLMSSLKLEGFHHATIHSRGYCAIVIKQRNQYTALLVRSQGSVADGFIEWARNFEPEVLKLDPRFRLA